MITFKIIYFVCMSVLLVCMSVHCVHTVPLEAKEGFKFQPLHIQMNSTSMALFTIPKLWTQPRCLGTECIKQMWLCEHGILLSQMKE